MIVNHGILPGQVLQRQKGGAKATVTGTCNERGEVLACIAVSKTKAVNGWLVRKVGRAADGKFTAKLDGIPVGGPYTVTLACGKERVRIKNVSVGDVWLLAGQSNMQGCGNMSDAPSPHPKVHAFYMDRHWDVAREPIHFLQESPDAVHNTTPFTPEQLKKIRKESLKGVGPGIYFGKEMLKRSRGVPQGLICTAHGGTSMQQWSPEKKNEGGNSLYGSMKLSLDACAQPIAGVLWYQGESDSNPTDAAVYTERMKALITSIRDDLKQPALPFLLVQIGRFFVNNSAARAWNSIQDQQANLHKHIKYTACVSAADLGLDDLIHIGAIPYERLGIRLARLADFYVYGNKKECPAPEYVSHKKSTENGVGITEISYKNVVGGLRSTGEPNGFVYVDDEHKNTNTVYKITLQGNKVRLEADNVQTQQGHLAYGNGFAPYLNITDGRDMPLPVLSPATLSKATGVTGFVTQWWVSGILPALHPIDSWEAPTPKPEYGLRAKKFEGQFCDNHLEWERHPGQAVFFAQMELPEDMKLNAKFGYDGPVRLWIDDHAVFTDINGTNPAIQDKQSIPLDLKKGTHKLAVAMDTNGGKAWGFFLRFERTDLKPEQVKGHTLAMPAFSA